MLLLQFVFFGQISGQRPLIGLCCRWCLRELRQLCGQKGDAGQQVGTRIQSHDSAHGVASSSTAYGSLFSQFDFAMPFAYLHWLAPTQTPDPALGEE